MDAGDRRHQGTLQYDDSLLGLRGMAMEQTRLTLECRKLYKNHMSPDSFLDSNIAQWYGEGKGGYHDIYILEIAHAYGAE